MHTIDNALDFARLCFLGAHHTLEESMLIFRWNGFKQLSNEYKLRLLVEFKFHHTEFIVKYRLREPPLEDHSASWSTVFTSDYKLEYDHAQIHEINYQLANKVYDFIAAKLAEADTPPA